MICHTILQKRECDGHELYLGIYDVRRYRICGV